MADEVTNAIKDNATGPKRAQGDSGSVEQHALPDQIAADRYLASKDAAKKGLGVRMTKVIPPGAVGFAEVAATTRCEEGERE